MPSARIRPESTSWINPKHPLNEGLVIVSAVGPGPPVNLMNNRVATITGTAFQPNYGGIGACLDHVGTGVNDSVSFALDPSITRASCTVECWFMTRVTNAIRNVWGFGSTFRVRVGTTGVQSLAAGVSITGVNTLTNGVMYQSVFTAGPGVGSVLYLNGMVEGVAASPSGNTTTFLQIFSDGSASTSCLDGTVALFRVWNRPLSPTEVLDTWNNPWAMFDRTDDILGFVPGAPPPATIYARRGLSTRVGSRGSAA